MHLDESLTGPIRPAAHFLTNLFLFFFEAVLGGSITGRARGAGLLEMNFINIRDFSKDKHRNTDDYPYSGGGGMLMTPQPIYDAYMSIAEGLPKKPHTVFLSPQGAVFDQKKGIFTLLGVLK